METRLLQAFLQPVSPGEPDHGAINSDAIDEAARLLSAGEVVAIPTETVYGLAANALDANAVKKIYVAKGRPSNNPLIVHVENAAQAETLAAHWPQNAQLLASAFWPGPLTMVVEKKPGMVADITTAGGSTVALRCPRHTIALEAIRRCGFPLAAPSANRSNALSPTTAIHVYESLGGRIPLILDGGPCIAGIESTVLDLTSDQPRVLRPGVLSANFLSEVLQCEVLENNPGQTHAVDSEKKVSPGQMKVHYAPKTPLYLVDPRDLQQAIRHFNGVGKLLAIIRLDGQSNTNGTSGAVDAIINDTIHIVMPASPKPYAQYLYATLHELDSRNLDVIICELPPQSQEWLAVNDRLLRAGKVWPWLRHHVQG